MKYRLIAVFVLSVLVVGLGGSTFADSKVKKSNGIELVSLLPASDGIMIIDARRAFDDALPKLLANNEPMLAKVTGTIDKFQEKSGIDVRKFESIAAGVTSRQVAAKKYDIEPVVIARGQMSSASLIGAAKLAANGKYTEEMVGDRAIYVFSVPATKTSTTAVSQPDTIAVTTIDSTTIAFGTPARVRQTLEGKSKVGTDLVGLLDRNPTAVTSFAAKLPAGLKAFLPLENDELGKNIDSIQYLYGHADVAGTIASVHMTARTLQAAQAKSLHDTLAGLQMLGKAFLGGAKGDDKKVYARMIENVKFATKGNEVTVDLQVPQSDIDVLVGKIR